MANARRTLIEIDRSVVGIGDRGEVLDVKRTPQIDNLIETGLAHEVNAKDVTSVVLVGTSEEREAATVDEVVDVPVGGSGS